MEKTALFPALHTIKVKKYSEGGERSGSLSLTSPMRSPTHYGKSADKAALLEAITRGEHLVTLLGQACRTIADATDDPDFLTQARQAVRGLGTAVNHKPTIQERYDGLLEQIRRLQAAQRVEDDPAIRALYQGMITERADWAAQIGAELDAITGGLRFTPPST